MPQAVYKPNRDKDEYVIFSTIVDNVTFGVLTRDEMLNLNRYPDWPNEETLQRADETGTSWIWGRTPQWDEEVLVTNIPEEVADFGWVKHRDLADFARAQIPDDIEALKRLVRPCEDD